ncbi:MAG: hypothetical protein QXT53_07975 [Ignisphaera sp.]
MNVAEGAEARRLLDKAVEVYNRYRAPEAIASIVGIEGDYNIMRFSGHFCVTCGVIDWIEDYVYILRDMGVKAEITKLDYFAEDNFVLVKLRIKSIYA